jgi:hypothetical protein
MHRTLTEIEESTQGCSPMPSSLSVFHEPDESRPPHGILRQDAIASPGDRPYTATPGGLELPGQSVER